VTGRVLGEVGGALGNLLVQYGRRILGVTPPGIALFLVYYLAISAILPVKSNCFN